MFFPTRRFGITRDETDRDLAAEQADIAEIVERVLRMQANAAAEQRRPLARGTHAKGVCARARFEVFDPFAGRDHELAARLANGMFAKRGSYPATVRFANSDLKFNPDFRPDVRSLSFSIELPPGSPITRQDFSLQSAPTLPINDARAFVATIKLLTASSPLKALWALEFRDKLRVLRTVLLAQLQAHQGIKPYQRLRYWSTVPFLHGARDVTKYCATPEGGNLANALDKTNPNALQDELARHLAEDGTMSSFDFGLQLLDTERMTYWGNRQDANFWIENASVRWNERHAPFHTVARLTLLPGSCLSPEASTAIYFDVNGNSMPGSKPVGSINRARWPAEVASRKARIQSVKSLVPLHQHSPERFVSRSGGSAG